MANTFGGFVHTSPLSSLPHDPSLSLASNCVRDLFGPIVQTVFDGLVKHGGSCTFPTLVRIIRKECQRSTNEERQRLIKNGKYKLSKTKGPGYVVEKHLVQASLLSLIQHDIVSVEQNKQKLTSIYTVHHRRALYLTRFPRFLEYIKKAMDETASRVVQTFITMGKLGTVPAVLHTVHSLDSNYKSEKYTPRQAVLEAFRRLVEGGFIRQVLPIQDDDDNTEDQDQDKPEDQDQDKPEDQDQDKPGGKDKGDCEMPQNSKDTPASNETLDDPAILQLLQTAPYKKTLPRDAVWKIHIRMFHDSIRAFCLGRLVAERYGNRITSCGSIVTAALKHQAYSKHVLNKSLEECTSFSPTDIATFLPKPVQQAMEKKPGGLVVNLAKALVDLSAVDYPKVLSEIEESTGHASGGLFSISTTLLVRHLRERVVSTMIYHQHGDVASRVVQLLRIQGHCESDAIAAAAMVPQKDTREILHTLYRHGLIKLFTLQQGKQHNPSAMVFLWHVDANDLLKIVRDKVCLAMTNIRLRRQHEEEVGKIWIDREGEDDKNENEADEQNYNKFCQGLERLDNALTQLDETMMVLFDF